MLGTDVLQNRPVRVEQIIEQQIRNRTWGRIHRLKVELTNDSVLVCGQTTTYYLKQLALHGAMEAMGVTSQAHIELKIDVGHPLPEAYRPSKRGSSRPIA